MGKVVRVLPLANPLHSPVPCPISTGDADQPEEKPTARYRRIPVHLYN